MSGGVDSATAAAWLVDQGHEVVGLTMQLWDHGETLPASSRTCCATEDLYDARQVAQRLDIPFYVINLEETFRQAVVDDFLSAYAAGQTPNPCVRCNQRLKFEPLLNKALSLGVDALATGHYAIRREDDGGHPLLYRGVDRMKDQSYFLFATTLSQLRHIAFPLGALTKEETRHLAKRFNLHLSNKRESQDVCFVPDGDYRAFFEREGSSAAIPGPIVDQQGVVLGEHKGVGNHTIGQRKGLGIAAAHPLYVIEIQAGDNRLVVGPESALYRESLTLKELNWLGRRGLEGPREVQAKIRYATEPVAATIQPLAESGSAHVQFKVPQKAITPGQACVLYDQERVMGGGWIC
ncbi:MAG: tRNA 2-thiouridine(34) synthase MnmA [Magnetococcales bacterium]|nr:tRNA 2-thiouridine(34) synthase MnmA [Magnetococcales bacterium]